MKLSSIGILCAPRPRAGTLVALALCGALAACAQQPLNGSDDAGKSATQETPTPAADTSAPSTPDAAATADAPAEAPAPAPVCQPAPVETQTKPKPKPKPVHRTEPKQPATAAFIDALPPGGSIVADVKPLAVSVVSILGKKVQGPKDEDMGRVVDVLADASGRVRVAIIDFGGFLGVGNRRIAVDWPLLRFDPDDHDNRCGSA